MKILLDLTSLDDNFSGIERFALNISKSLIRDNSNQYILVFKNKVHKEFEGAINNKNIKVEVIKGKSKLLTNQVKLPLKLYRLKSDKYVFLAFPSPLLFFKKGTINAIHDMTAWLYPETMSKKGLILFRGLIKKAMISSESIITVSQNSKNDINNVFKNNNIPIDIIYNGVDDKFMDFKFTKEESEKISNKYKLGEDYILCLGTIEPRKNIILLIDSYIELRKQKLINNKLVIVGRKGWKYNEIFNKIKNNNLENEVIFTGFVEDIDLPYVYNMAKFFVFPSLYEGFGIPLIESMAVGTPVIGSNTSSIPEVIGEAGLLFENNNKEDLKLKIIELNKMERSEKNHLSNKGIKRSKMFRWNKEANKLLDRWRS